MFDEVNVNWIHLAQDMVQGEIFGECGNKFSCCMKAKKFLGG
jgi:hypothetical protein